MKVERGFIFDPSLVLYLPLYRLDGSSFMSQDAYGHLCTVTGAVWRPNGRYFDGVDDVITIPTHAGVSNIFTGGGTLISWVNPIDAGENSAGMMFHKDNSSTGIYFSMTALLSGKVGLSLLQRHSTTFGLWNTTAKEISINTWTFIAATYNSDKVTNNPIFYVNNRILTVGGGITEVITPVGTPSDDSADDLTVGNSVAGIHTFHGHKGESIMCSRELTPVEIQNIYLATKWRYR